LQSEIPIKTLMGIKLCSAPEATRSPADQAADAEFRLDSKAGKVLKRTGRQQGSVRFLFRFRDGLQQVLQ
jgi:hypothetical protein